MRSAFKPGLLSFVVLVVSFFLSLLLGDGFGMAQMVMAILTGVSPLVISYLDERSRLQSNAKSEELESLKANIQSLEAEVSRINLALKLRN
jgi:hypothetical protein